MAFCVDRKLMITLKGLRQIQRLARGGEFRGFPSDHFNGGGWVNPRSLAKNDATPTLGCAVFRLVGSESHHKAKVQDRANDSML